MEGCYPHVQTLAVAEHSDCSFRLMLSLVWNGDWVEWVDEADRRDCQWIPCSPMKVISIWGWRKPHYRVFICLELTMYTRFDTELTEICLCHLSEGIKDICTIPCSITVETLVETKTTYVSNKTYGCD